MGVEENPHIYGLITAILKSLCLCTIILELSMTLLFLFKQKEQLSLMLQVWPPARSDDLVETECSLCDAIIPNPAQKDEVIWTQSSNGKFSISSPWNLFRHKAVVVDWHKLIWVSQRIPKQSFISWLTILNRLSTFERQAQWGRKINTTCLLCNADMETRDHLFFSCPFSNGIWQKILQKCEMSRPAKDWTNELNRPIGYFLASIIKSGKDSCTPP